MSDSIELYKFFDLSFLILGAIYKISNFHIKKEM
jgi:hypothetical protein